MKTAGTSNGLRTVSWVLQAGLAVAFIVMGAMPKFTGDPMSVAIFETLGFPPGRFLVGTLEALAAVLLVAPKMHALGGALAGGLMLGAVGSHLGPLGVQTELTVGGETSTHPELFVMALALGAVSAAVVVLRRDELPLVGASPEPVQA